MIWTKPELAHMAIDAADAWHVPPALVCAIIEVSSQWNVNMEEWEPEPWLTQAHPYDFPGGETEFLALGTRWGLMQFMGSRAKQAGYKGELSAKLIEPKHNLDAGCCILKNCFGNGQITMPMVLTGWYGMSRRGLVGLTLAMVPTFQEFVRQRPQAERVPAG